MRSFLISFISLSVIICSVVKKQSEKNVHVKKSFDSFINSLLNRNFTVNDTGLVLKDQSKFRIGASVDAKRLYKDSRYADIVINQFNSLTTENALKWATAQPEKDHFNFNKGDSIVMFAQSHNMRVHGHVLVTVSAGSLPDWVSGFQGNTEAWESMFKNHIQTEVNHYKGKITSWDVVNETFDDDGNVRSTTQSATDANIWLEHLGPDYTARAFQYAHEADPNALLFYNDNKQETSERKLDAILNMVTDFKKRNIPINGLGVQMHININTPEDGIANALKKLAQTGLKIHISELDIRINPNNSFIDSASALKAQAEKYFFVAHAYSTIVPKAQQYGITFWNVTDKDSWIVLSKHAQDCPLLFNKNYEKKPAFEAFVQGLQGQQCCAVKGIEF